MVLVISGQSFDTVCEEAIMQEQSIERAILYANLTAAEITESDVWLEPVHDSTKWLSLTSAQVEPYLLLSEDTQDGPYFK